MEFIEVTHTIEQPRAVDVGTGSGCLAIACAHQRPTACLVAIDCSAEALALARTNAERHGVAERIEFRLGDALLPVASESPFDVILSNPPYIATGDISSLEPGVRDYEPHLALDGGPDGLRVAARIIDQAAPLLRPGGHLILEIGTAQERPIRGLIDADSRYELAPSVLDLRNHPRVIRAVRRAEV
jgi:release factor glutamine methyltransferase